jgi:hypothetical protein
MHAQVGNGVVLQAIAGPAVVTGIHTTSVGIRAQSGATANIIIPSGAIMRLGLRTGSRILLTPMRGAMLRIQPIGPPQ